ncbi:DUF4157 domain-containing protein [Roseobacter fucihabitans]|nr:DUF4157 domain-containing protein [Roseobacter litoralis]
MAYIFASEHARKPSPSARPASRALTGSNLTSLQAGADTSTGAQSLATFQLAADTVQRMEEEEMLQGKAAGSTLAEGAVQLMEEEEPLQGRAEGSGLSDQALQQKPDGGTAQGLPPGLRAGAESLSGIDMSGVQVHYNSDKPSQLQAHAYAQGQQIHLASGQERHLPHEAWHVVQQAQGRVRPTLQVAGQAVNDEPGLESEADLMGARAMQEGSASLRD